MQTRNVASRVLVFIFLGLIAFSLLVFFSGCFGAGGRKGFLEVSGRIEGREHNVGSKIAGRIDEVYTNEGKEVASGEPLALIYSKQTTALLAAAEARLNEAKANLNLAEVEHERYSRLFKESAIPKMEYDYVENRYIGAKEELVAAEKEVDKHKADLEDTKIISPISGTIVTKIVRKGEVIAAGTPIATIVNMDDLYLKVFLSTELAGKVNLGDEAKVYPDALPGEAFNAFVEKIGQKAEFTPKNVETKSQRAKLVFEIKLQIKENTGHKLKPGMPCDGVIKIDKKASWASFKPR